MIVQNSTCSWWSPRSWMIYYRLRDWRSGMDAICQWVWGIGGLRSAVCVRCCWICTRRSQKMELWWQSNILYCYFKMPNNKMCVSGRNWPQVKMTILWFYTCIAARRVWGMHQRPACWLFIWCRMGLWETGAQLSYSAIWNTTAIFQNYFSLFRGNQFITILKY